MQWWATSSLPSTSNVHWIVIVDVISKHQFDRVDLRIMSAHGGELICASNKPIIYMLRNQEMFDMKAILFHRARHQLRRTVLVYQYRESHVWRQSVCNKFLSTKPDKPLLGGEKQHRIVLFEITSKTACMSSSQRATTNVHRSRYITKSIGWRGEIITEFLAVKASRDNAMRAIPRWRDDDCVRTRRLCTCKRLCLWNDGSRTTKVKLQTLWWLFVWCVMCIHSIRRNKRFLCWHAEFSFFTRNEIGGGITSGDLNSILLTASTPWAHEWSWFAT